MCLVNERELNGFLYNRKIAEKNKKNSGPAEI